MYCLYFNAMKLLFFFYFCIVYGLVLSLTYLTVNVIFFQNKSERMLRTVSLKFIYNKQDLEEKNSQNTNCYKTSAQLHEYNYQRKIL